MLFSVGDVRASVSSDGVVVNGGARRRACQPKAHRSCESVIKAEGLMNYAGLDCRLVRQPERAARAPLR